MTEADGPLISLLVPVYKPVIEELEECISSVIGQSYPRWQLCLALDGPQPAEVRQAISSFDDPRISTTERPANGGISAASNDALDLAEGDYVGLLDNDDLLAPFALERVADVIGYWPAADFIYSDEDKIDANGSRTDHFAKPGWSPERLRSHMYTGHFTVYATDLVRQVGGFRTDFDGSQDHDLALRVSEQAECVVHIPEVLYHWRMSLNSVANEPGAKPWAYEAGRLAVQDHCDRTGIDADAEIVPGYWGYVRVNPRRSSGMVSIVIWSQGSAVTVGGDATRSIDRTVSSILSSSTHPDIEVIVVVPIDAASDLEAALTAINPSRVRVLRRPQAQISRSAALNVGTVHARGETLVFVDDGVQVLTADWLERLELFAGLEGVGAVGCRIEEPDGRLRHAGRLARLVPRFRGAGSLHVHYGLMGGLRASTQNSSLVGDGCLAIRKEVFEDVGGFSSLFPVAYGDVDLSFRLLEQRRRNVVDIHAALVAHATALTEAEERSSLHQLESRWHDRLRFDLYDNPAFGLDNAEEFPPPPALTMLREQSHDRDSPRACIPWAKLPPKDTNEDADDDTIS